MLKKIKKGVKRVMKEVKTIIDDSFTKEVYDNLRESFYDKNKSKQIGVMVISAGLGVCVIGVGFVIKNIM